MLTSESRAQPTAVCVTGMHRCGTSFAASALRELGVSLGDPAQHMRPGGDNPAGYFELQPVMELNEELLAELGGAWDQPPVLEPGWERAPELDPFRARAAQVLRTAFPELDRAERSTIAWKDPRISILLPFWRTVIPIAKTIVLVRDPREVAESLASRKYAVAAPQAASLWLRYVYAATRNDPGYLLLRYSDLHDDLPATMAAIAEHLGMAQPDAAALARAREQLDPSLRHYVARESADVDVDPIMRIALDVWAAGAMRLDAVSPAVADALAGGWLRPPVDGELLARARAEAVRLRETLRAKNRDELQRARQ